jgi:hypothetical protein
VPVIHLIDRVVVCLVAWLQFHLSYYTSNFVPTFTHYVDMGFLEVDIRGSNKRVKRQSKRFIAKTNKKRRRRMKPDSDDDDEDEDDDDNDYDDRSSSNDRLEHRSKATTGSYKAASDEANDAVCICSEDDDGDDAS